MGAKFAQLLFIHRRREPGRPRPRTPDRRPPLAIDIGVRLTRIDKVVPQDVEYFLQAVFNLRCHSVSPCQFRVSRQGAKAQRAISGWLLFGLIPQQHWHLQITTEARSI
jgi:hypothetical protein